MTQKAQEQEVSCPPNIKNNELSRNSYSLHSSLTFHLHTLWLFTVSEHFTIVCPWTAFGIFSALSGSPLTTNPTPDLFTIIARLPRTIFWMWLNILAFTVSNQRLPNSVAEDSVNKAWRPLPSGRLTLTQARRLLMVVIPTLLLSTRFLGGMEVTMMSLLFTWMYNDLEGADDSYITRNLINSMGLTAWSIGTTLVACGHGGYTLDPAGYHWFALEFGIIFTTLHIQDLRDQAGDRIRGRQTAPLVWGDGIARWSIAIPILVWSFVCPTIWSLGV
ncbi:MAG: hypothetical protein M1830_001374, partial [Pleopsidium flavum]